MWVLFYWSKQKVLCMELVPPQWWNMCPRLVLPQGSKHYSVIIISLNKKVKYLQLLVWRTLLLLDIEVLKIPYRSYEVRKEIKWIYLVFAFIIQMLVLENCKNTQCALPWSTGNLRDRLWKEEDIEISRQRRIFYIKLQFSQVANIVQAFRNRVWEIQTIFKIQEAAQLLT